MTDNQLNSQMNFYNSNQGEQKFNDKLVRNNRIFVGIFALFQILFMFMYGFFGAYPSYVSETLNDVHGLFIACGVAALVLIGFGLVLGYMKHLSFSGLGFTLLITSITFQWYFIVNAFWSKVNIQPSLQSFAATDDFPLRLSEDFGLAQPLNLIFTDGSTAVGAFKASLSMVVAFAAILGRGGPLQMLIMVILGTILYELNRQVIANFSVDVGGSNSIFAFGGCFGTGVAVILYFLRQKLLVSEHPNFRSYKFNAVLAGIGGIFCWVFFPFLAMDGRAQFFSPYLGGINTLYGVSACVITTAALDAVIFGRARIRGLIYSPIAGGIMVATSSNMITNPLSAILLGIIAAVCLVIFNIIDQKFSSNPIFSNNAALLFGAMGFLGGLAGSVFRAIAADPQGFDFSLQNKPFVLYDSRAHMSAAFISIGIGFATGIVTGLILLCFSSHDYGDNFTDDAYWVKFSDGISDRIQSPNQEIFVYGDRKEIKGTNAYL